MLDGDHYRTAELVNQLMNNAVIKHTFDLIELIKPDLTIVDNQQGGKVYCYNYKGIIIAEGETVYATMMHFQEKFYTQKAGDIHEQN